MAIIQQDVNDTKQPQEIHKSDIRVYIIEDEKRIEKDYYYHHYHEPIRLTTVH